MKKKLNILFLCTGNSCRSQMAEGFAKSLKSESINAYSAGIETHGLNENAVLVMKNAGVDISKHKSQNVLDLMNINFDFVITVCGNAQESCPVFPGKAKIIHKGFDDPPKLAINAKNKEEELCFYVEVRDKIKEYIALLPDVLYN